jgi:outer membrane biosynthesis protein TonB
MAMMLVFELFAGCKPQGNFYLVAAPSAPAESCATRNQPEVAFWLTKSGEVRNIALTRGSGSPSVDRKELQRLRDSRYSATNCGACFVFARVPVSLKCR